MADFTVNNIILDMDAPLTGTHLKNLKELSVGGDGQISLDSDGILSFNNTAGNIGKIRFKYGGDNAGSIFSDSSKNMVYYANTKHFFQNLTGSVGFAEIGADGLLLGSDTSIFFTLGSTITDTGATLDIDRTLLVHGGDIALDTGYKFQIGTTPGVTISSGNVGGLFEINTVGGLVTYFHKY